MQPYPPLQTLLAAAVLAAAGNSGRRLRPDAGLPAKASKKRSDTHRPDLVVVCEDDFNFLSKMCLARNRELAFRLATAARARGIPIAVHGPMPPTTSTNILRAGFDAVRHRRSGNALCWNCASGRRLTEHSRAWRSERPSGVRSTRHARCETDLDSLPLPGLGPGRHRRYRNAWLSTHGYFSLNMVSSRGCPYRCNWCAKPIYGNNYHARSPQSVAAEMLHLKRTLRPDHIWFADDIFALSRRWTLDSPTPWKRSDARIPFKMQSRCDLMTRDTVTHCAAAGCAEVWMGAESGSQKILDAMDKGIRVEQIHERCENSAASRHSRLLVPAVRLSRRRLGRHRGDYPHGARGRARRYRRFGLVSAARHAVSPDLCRGQLGAKANWNDSGDLAMMFRGTYRPISIAPWRMPFTRRFEAAAMRSVRTGSGSTSFGQSRPGHSETVA